MDFGPFRIDLAKAAALSLAALYLTDLLKRLIPALSGRWVQITAFGIALLLSVFEVAFAEKVPTGRDLARALIQGVLTAAVAIGGADLRNKLDRRDTQPATPDPATPPLSTGSEERGGQP